MSDDVDVDALCAELDDILDKPASKSSSAASRGKPSVLASHARPAASSSGSFGGGGGGSGSFSSQGQRASAFDLTDSDDDDAPKKKVPAGRPVARASPPPQPQSRFQSTAASAAPPAASAASSFSSSSTSGARRPAPSSSGGNDSDDDLNNLLADMDSAISKGGGKATKLNLKPAPVVHDAPSIGGSSPGGGSSNSSGSTSFGRGGGGPKAKCSPTLLTNGNPGLRACNSLLCTACDQPVVCFKASKWREGVVDYLFFRNHYPDLSRFQSAGGIDRAPGHAAYCCMCSWQSVGMDSLGTESINVATLDRRDTSHKEGCSSWQTLKWVCMGH